MDEHTLAVAERDIARPSPSRKWVDKQRSMRTSLRGGGTTGCAAAGSRENPVKFVHCLCGYTMFVHCSWL